MASKIYALIATYHPTDLLARTLNSLAECEIPEDFGGTIIIENGPKMIAEEEVRKSAPSIRAQYKYVATTGRSNAMNVGFSNLPDDSLVIFFDDDLRFSTDILVRYAQAAKGCTTGKYFGGPLDVDYESSPDSWLVPYLPFSARGWRAEKSLTNDTMPRFLGANWAAFVGDIRRLGGYNIRFGHVGAGGVAGDETDMQARLVGSGVRPVYVPDALVWHYVPQSRCNPTWVLERTKRGGILVGIQHRDGGFALSCVSLAWSVLRLIQYGLPLCLIVPLFVPRWRFRQFFRCSHYLGRIKGLFGNPNGSGEGSSPEPSTAAGG